jgi:hypothetical protein
VATNRFSGGNQWLVFVGQKGLGAAAADKSHPSFERVPGRNYAGLPRIMPLNGRRHLDGLGNQQNAGFLLGHSNRNCLRLVMDGFVKIGQSNVMVQHRRERFGDHRLGVGKANRQVDARLPQHLTGPRPGGDQDFRLKN